MLVLSSFNPRTHTGCDKKPGVTRAKYHVSIHAPTRGATMPRIDRFSSSIGFNPRTHTGCDAVRGLGLGDQDSVSIHAPTRGATICGSYISVIIYSFNPRTHTGCDEAAAVGPPSFRVSIHAPTRGATTAIVTLSQNDEFQSTHPHGVRRDGALGKGSVEWFQSTHPHGVRPENFGKCTT